MTHDNQTAYHFFRRTTDGHTAFLGTASRHPDGWRFIPHVSGRKPSRKPHPTMEKCLPSWLRYPNGCESEPV